MTRDVPGDKTGDKTGDKAGPRFSVIINSYNGAAFLRDAIDSVLAQSLADWELLIWDDGSTDASAAIAASYADPRIRAIAQPRNTGLGTARNAAVAAARGAWIAFLDQDDIWASDKLAAQSALIAADRTGRLGLVYGRATRFDTSGGRGPFDMWFGSGRLPEGDILAELLAKASFIAFSSTVFRAAALRRCGAIPDAIQFCPDYWLTVVVARHYAAACVQAPCCWYRVHAASMSHVHRRRIHEEAIRIVETVALPTQARLVARRRKIHETWIGVERMRGGQPWRGVAHVLARGSLSYLVLRPAVLLARALRERARNRAPEPATPIGVGKAAE